MEPKIIGRETLGTSLFIWLLREQYSGLRLVWDDDYT